MKIGASFKYYYLLATERSIFFRAIRVSVLVGIILNLINNPGIFSSIWFPDLHPGRVILTFIVPFGVSTYSSILSGSFLKPGKISQIDAILKCNSCKQTSFTVNIGEQIDACPKCKKDTRWKLSKIFSSVRSGNDVLKSLALFARHNPQPLFRLDINGIIIGANPASEVMFNHKNLSGEKLENLVQELEGIDLKHLVDHEEVMDVIVELHKGYYNFILKGVQTLQNVHVYGNEITKIVQAEQKIRIQAKEINDSIQYAWRIQKSLLPGETSMSAIFPSNFVFYRPRNIVSGDFYWMNQVGDNRIIAVADCTGHGVPGAFMSMLGISLLNDIILREEIVEPDEILNELRKRLILALSSNQEDSELSDGMDIALVTVNSKQNSLAFAGAFNPLFINRDGNLIIHKADKMPVGKFIGKLDPFTVKRDKIENGDRIFLFTDGYPDQFGGEKNKKYSQKRLRELLMKANNLSCSQVEVNIQDEFYRWKSDNDQVDDVLVVGIEIA